VRCVLLHGFLGDPASWDDVPVDGERIALPGHAGGGPVERDWAANLAAVAARIGPCEAVVGYSLGARVALGLVVDGHAPRAVLISGNPGIDHEERAVRRASDAVWARLARERGMEAFLDAWEAQPLFATQRRASAERLTARRKRRLALDPEQVARSLEAMGLAEMPDYRLQLDHQSGRDDRFGLIVGGDDLKYSMIAHALPARVELIAGSGHDPLLEQPALLARAISRSLGPLLAR
jgi:2-succinyl-6-hydroxy-2,4-cyclohexadiene-1-carboxylate synthase